MMRPLPCPCCGSAATVEPHLIEAGCRIGGLELSDWWTASINCDSCPLQFIAGGDTEAEAVEAAVAGWNRRAAVGRAASPDGLSVLGGNLVVVADRFTDAVLVLKPEPFGDGFDVATYAPRGELEEARALVRSVLSAVEALRDEVAELRREVETVMIELGCDMKVESGVRHGA